MDIGINDWQIWVVYSKRYPVGPKDRLFTESPGVYEALKDSYMIEDISGTVTMDEANDLGRRVVRLCFEWQAEIDRFFEPITPGIPIGKILGRSLPNVMNCFCYHHLLLERAVSDASDRIVVPYLTAEPKNVLQSEQIVSLAPVQTNYFGLVAQHGGTSEIIEALPLDKDQFGSPNMLPGKVTERMGAWQAFLSVLLLSMSTRSIWLQSLLFNRVYSRHWVKILLSILLPKRRHAFFFLMNDLNIHLVHHLLLRGVRVSRVSVSGGTASERADALDATGLADVLIALCKDKDMVVPLAAAAKRIQYYVSGYFLPLYKTLQESQQTDIETAPATCKACFLTNSLGDPRDILLSRLFHNAGVPVINFQHGGIGLVEMYNLSQHFSDMSNSDGFVCFNEYERDFYKALTGDRGIQFFVKGVKHEQSAPFPRIARRLARRLWNVRGDDKVLLYAPTRFKEGQVFPFDVYDMKYWAWMKALLYDGVAKSDVQCVVKVHQKGLWSSLQATLYQKRKNPLLEIELPGNVYIEFYPQLNYSRFAADILLIDRATSTLGWALAADIPLIYVEMPFSRLIPEVRDAMNRAVFVVDGSEEAWTDILRRLLDMPLNELKSRWRKKEGDRQRFNERYVTGPDRGYKDLTEWVFNVEPKPDFASDRHEERPGADFR